MTTYCEEGITSFPKASQRRPGLANRARKSPVLVDRGVDMTNCFRSIGERQPSQKQLVREDRVIDGEQPLQACLGATKTAEATRYLPSTNDHLALSVTARVAASDAREVNQAAVAAA